MTALEACDEVRQKLQDTLLKGLGKAEDYGLFQPNKDDPKKGVWLDPQKSLSYYMLEMRVCKGFASCKNTFLEKKILYNFREVISDYNFIPSRIH